MAFESLEKDQLENLIAVMANAMIPLIDDRNKLNERIVKLGQELKEARERLYELQYQEMLANNTVDWAMLMNAGPSGDDHYTQVKNEMKKLVPSGGLTFDGYFPETGQHALQVKLTRGNKHQITEAATALKILIPLYTPLDNYHGVLIFKIFEASLSEYTSYKFCFDPESNNWYWGAWNSSVRYAKTKADMLKYLANGPFATPEEMLQSISMNCYYETDEE